MGSERADDGLQLPLIQFGTARRGPWFGFRAGGTKDRLSGSMQSFFGMISVENLDGLRKQFLGGVPDPARTIPQYRASGRLGEASPCRFSQHTLGEIGSVEAGVQSGGAFDGGRISDRSWVSHRRTLLIPRFRGVHGDDLGLASFGRAIRL